MKYLTRMASLATAAVVALSTGCDSADYVRTGFENTVRDGDSTPEEGHATVWGTIEKGPFLAEQIVTITRLDAHFDPTGEEVEVLTHTGGRFTGVVPFDGPVLIEARGSWFNESNGRIEDAPLTLRGVVALPRSEPIRVTAFSHISADATLSLAGAGAPLDDALAGAEGLLHDELNIAPEWLDLSDRVGQLHPLSGTDPESAYALWTSAVIAQSGGDNVGLWLDTLAADLSSDGVFSGENALALERAAEELDPEKVTSLLQGWFDENGMNDTAPDLRQILDMDGDGTPDNADDDADGDGYFNPASGGGDCDDLDPVTLPRDEMGVDPTLRRPLCTTDADGDGFSEKYPREGIDAGTDCDDSDPATYPGAAFNDDKGQDCMRDADGDGWGDRYSHNDVIPGSDSDDTDPKTQ